MADSEVNDLPQKGTLKPTDAIYGVDNDATPTDIRWLPSAAIWFFGNTEAEDAALVTPTDYRYEPGNVLRYGTNTTPGTTDMTAAIQAACDSTHDVRGDPGDTYLITGVTQSTDNQTIDFSGCTLKLADASSTFMMSCSGDHVEVKGGTWDGNKAGGQTTADSFFDHAAVNITGDHCTVRGIVSKNSAGIGIKGTGCNHVLITENYVKQWDVTGIYTESTVADAFGNRVIGNFIDFIDSGVGGINLLGNNDRSFLSYNYIIDHNIVVGYSGMGVAEGGIFTRSPNGTISNNVIQGMPFGITTDHTDYMTISDNVIYGINQSPGYGIEVGGSHSTISGNSISDCIFGIIGAVPSRDMDNLTITGNNIQNCVTHHIQLAPPVGQTAHNLTITGNTFTWASGATGDEGVSLVRDCKYALISGNNFVGPGISNTQARGVKITNGPGHVSVTGNRFSGIFRPFDTFNSLSDTFADGDVTTGTDRITLTAHAFVNKTLVQLTTSGTLPAGLALATDYYTKYIDDDTIELYSDSDLSSIVDITAAAGGGTHTIAAFSITNLNFSSNDCSNDMPVDTLFMITSGDAVLADNCVQMNNIISTGFGRNYMDRLNNVLTKHGAGTPEGAVIAGIGSFFYRTDGGANTSVYVKESGTGAAGWVAK